MNPSVQLGTVQARRLEARLLTQSGGRSLDGEYPLLEMTSRYWRIEAENDGPEAVRP
jgi:hypothetical protein